MQRAGTPWVFLAPAVAGLLAYFLLPPIPQPENYHHFADYRAFFSVPNFWNVISNLPFAVVGVVGLRFARDTTSRILFGGIFLVAFGSGYYHLAPGDSRLVWDRLPMTVAFMAILALLVQEFWSRSAGKWSLAPLLGIGIFSVFWWQHTADLRLYGLVQFIPILTILLTVIVYRPAGSRFLWLAFAFYAGAKVCELFDPRIYAALNFSGHTIKHLLAACSTYWIYRWRLVDERTVPEVMIQEGATAS